MMANVREMRRPLTIVAAVLVGISIAAAAILLSPLARDSKSAAEQKRAHEDLQRVAHQAIPLQNIDQKIRTAQEQVNAFYRDRLPQRDSDVAGELGKLAEASGIRLSTVRYNQPVDTDLPSLQRLEMDIALAGEYQRVVKFINALERDPTFFIIDRVNLAEQQGGNVRLELHLETYFYREAAATTPTT